MHKSQHGFAVVEAVLAIVLLGIVGVTILGQLGGPLDDVSTMQGSVDAKTSSAAAINFSARILDPVAFAGLEARDVCADQDLDAGFPPDFDNSGWFYAGSGTTCR